MIRTEPSPLKSKHGKEHASDMTVFSVMHAFMTSDTTILA